MVDVKRYERDEKEINTLVKSGKFVANDIRICFGIEKCSILVLRREKKHCVRILYWRRCHYQ